MCCLPELTRGLSNWRNYRNHRKIVVIGGVSAILAFNVGDEYLEAGRDLLGVIRIFRIAGVRSIHYNRDS